MRQKLGMCWKSTSVMRALGYVTYFNLGLPSHLAPFVYRLGHWVFIPVRAVRLRYGVPLVVLLWKNPVFTRIMHSHCWLCVHAPSTSWLKRKQNKLSTDSLYKSSALKANGNRVIVVHNMTTQLMVVYGAIDAMACASSDCKSDPSG